MATAKGNKKRSSDSYDGIPKADRAEVREQLAHYRDSATPQIVHKVMVERRQRPTDAEVQAQRETSERERPVNRAVDGLGVAVHYLNELVNGDHGELDADLLSVCIEGMAGRMAQQVEELRTALEQERRPTPVVTEEMAHG